MGTNSGTYCDTPYSLQHSGYLDLQHGSNVKNETEEGRREGKGKGGPAGNVGSRSDTARTPR